jgi:peptidoglycan hydrolase-like protein with peptidoglycan-binding domain
MKRILLATAATIALSLPAMAQGQQQPAGQNMQQPMDQNRTNQMNSQGGSSQMGGGSSSGMQQQASQRIDPSDLSQDQMTQIQQALNQKGFDTKSVDGKWGPDTRAALRKFQQQNNLQGSGQLDEQTLAQLGVNFQGQGQGTVGSGSGTNGSNMGSGSPMTPGSGSPSGMDQNPMSPSGSGTGTGTGTTGQPQ